MENNDNIENDDIFTIEPFQAVLKDKDSLRGFLFKSIPDSVVLVKRNIRGTTGILRWTKPKESLEYDMSKHGIAFIGKRVIDRYNDWRNGSPAINNADAYRYRYIILISKKTQGDDKKKSTNVVQYTRDNEEAHVDFYYSWVVSDPGKYLSASENPESELNGAIQAYVRAFISSIDYNILNGLDELDLQSNSVLSSRLPKRISELGIEVINIKFKTIMPSKTTQEARARAKQTRIDAEARLYEAEKQNEINKRNAENARDVAKINLEAEKFNADADAYRIEALRNTGLSEQGIIDAVYSSANADGKYIFRGGNSDYVQQGASMGAAMRSSQYSNVKPTDAEDEKQKTNRRRR